MIVRSPYLILVSLYLTQSIPNFKELFKLLSMVIFSPLYGYFCLLMFSLALKKKSKAKNIIVSSNIKTIDCLVSRN